MQTKMHTGLYKILCTKYEYHTLVYSTINKHEYISKSEDLNKLKKHFIIKCMAI